MSNELHHEPGTHRLLGRPLTTLVLGLCLAQLAIWIPQYLFWPWWVNASEFCFNAQQWDDGTNLPYRDILNFNFPGEIYLHWVLGKACGWGSTTGFYALDALFVVGFGAALAAWSRRLLGRVLPGAVGFLAFLAFYLDLGYEVVGQRDWHASLLGVLGLMAVESGRGRTSWVASALLLALGMSFRPQIVLLVPAYIYAINARSRGSRAARIGEVLGWGTVVGVGLILAFSPLYYAGILDDYLWGRWGLGHVRPGGSYNNEGAGARVVRFISQINPTVLVLVGVNAAFAARHPEARPRNLTWLIALAFVSIYRPLSPHTSHMYLSFPIRVVLCVHFSLAAQALLQVAEITPRYRLVGLALLIALAMPSRPRFLPIRHSLAVIWDQKARLNPPPSYVPSANDYSVAYYYWDNYRDLLVYLDHNTAPDTRVANILYYTPAVVGNVPRPSVFPASALNFLKSDPSLLGHYIKCLEGATKSVVVWSPTEARLMRSRDEGVPSWERSGIWEAFIPLIERDYVQEKRFGEIEVWRRKVSE